MDRWQPFEAKICEDVIATQIEAKKRQAHNKDNEDHEGDDNEKEPWDEAEVIESIEIDMEEQGGNYFDGDFIDSLLKELKSTSIIDMLEATKPQGVSFSKFWFHCCS
jgi:hypothetical protein